MGRGFARPQRVGMGWESFPRHAGQGRDGARQNHAGRGRRSHPSAPPHPIAIPTSSTSMDAGLGTFSAKAAMTCPLLFRTTTPILAWFDSTTKAPSKFVFTISPSGGFHLMLHYIDAFIPDREWHWKSLSSEAALSRILPSGILGSLHLTLFLRPQMNQAIVANNTSWFACSPTRATRSVTYDILGWSFKIHPKNLFPYHAYLSALP